MLGTVLRDISFSLHKNFIRKFNVVQANFQRREMRQKSPAAVQCWLSFLGSLLTPWPHTFLLWFNIFLMLTYWFLTRNKCTAALSKDAASHSDIYIMSYKVNKLFVTGPEDSVSRRIQRDKRERGKICDLLLYITFGIRWALLNPT